MIGCKYYKGIFGVVGVRLIHIGHQDSGYTLLIGYIANYNWIKSEDLYDSYDEAYNGSIAKFLFDEHE